MNLFTYAIQALLSLSFMISGIAAMFRPRWLDPLPSILPTTGIGRVAISVIFWVCAVATLIGIFVPFAVFFASCLALACSLFFAWRIGQSKVLQTLPIPALMAMASVAVAMVQPLGLKVLALPKADDLPFVPSPSRVVKTYDVGLWLEGIAAADDGTLYLAGNRGLEFSRSDYYRDAQGELIARKPSGEEVVLFKTPKGTTAGVVAVASDGTLFMTSHGEPSSIWRIDTKGNSQRITQFPDRAWPNGIDIGPDGMLYSPDSTLGVVWRVNPGNGNAEVALKDPALLARPYIALAPGANGLHFKGRDMFVTVSDQATVLKYPMDDKGQLGAAQVIATGIPGDDFAIGQDGSLFITTHPYNTLVRVAPDGQRTIIGKAEQHIVGATDAVFGKTDKDRTTLYVVTDGGAFSGGPNTRGELVAVQVN